jgi:hypothetical protein
MAKLHYPKDPVRILSSSGSWAAELGATDLLPSEGDGPKEIFTLHCGLDYKESDVHVAKVRDLNVPIWGYPPTMSSHQKLRENHTTGTGT